MFDRELRFQRNHAALTQVLSNLLANAVKFVPPDVLPLVRIGAAGGTATGLRRDAALGTRVGRGQRDRHGPISAAALVPSLSAFTRPGPYEGTGIGLAIARKAIERMGGVIGVDSEVGKGCRFWFILPAAG